MIIVAGTIRVPTDKLQDAQPHFERVVKASRQEPGCVLYSFAHDALEGGVIRVFEVYRDQAALEAHRASDHFKVWRAANPDLGVSDRDITVYEIAAARKV